MTGAKQRLRHAITHGTKSEDGDLHTGLDCHLLTFQVMARHSSRSATDVGGSSVSDRTDATSMNSRNAKNRKPYSPELQDICRIGGEQQEPGTPSQPAKCQGEDDDACAGGKQNADIGFDELRAHIDRRYQRGDPGDAE